MYDKCGTNGQLQSEVNPNIDSVPLRIPMSDTQVDTSKRTWIIATGCAGAVGGAAVAVPFVSTFQPSERAKAAGAAVEVDISALKAGEMTTS
jgi:ubiquinol-cytochrome c reductase iron-sulfur subunit